MPEDAMDQSQALRSPGALGSEGTIDRIRGFLSGSRKPPQIRRATEQDCEAILRAHEASVATLSAQHYSTEQIKAWIAHRQLHDYRAAVQNALVLVAERNEQVIGFAQMDLISGIIHAVHVHPNHIGQGVGRCLLNALEAEARAAGLRRLRLDATLNAVAFCQARGYMPLANGASALSNSAGLACVQMEKCL